MRIRSSTITKATLPALAAAFLCTTGAQAQIVAGGYTCGGSDFTRSHNNALHINIRWLVCALPTSSITFFNNAVDAELAGSYTTVKCMDWSLWSSTNANPQTIIVRVFQDLAPGRDETGNCTGIDENLPGPSAGGSVLLWTEEEVFAPDIGGTTIVGPGACGPSPAPGMGGRIDGDTSTVFEGPTGGGVLLPPDASFFVEVLHLGEAVTRYGSNLCGEAGDGNPASTQVSWCRAYNCGGGGCSGGGCNPAGGGGAPPCTANAIIKWSEFSPGTDRDTVVRVKLDLGDTTIPGPLGFCPQDIAPVGSPDKSVGVADLLELLATWGTLAPPRPSGDIAPLPNGDNQVNVTDLVGLLGAWGPCPDPNKLCADLVASDPQSLNPARISADGSSDFQCDPLYLDGPPRGPTNDINEVLRGPSTCGWLNFGAGGIPGGFQFGTSIGENPASFTIAGIPGGTVGGDAWFLYTAPCDGKAFFETTNPCPTGAGRVDDTLIEVYPGEACPTDWATFLACDDSSGTMTACGDHASVGVDVASGEDYLVRIGGWLGESGTATLVYSCVDNSACEAGLPLALGSSTSGNTAAAAISGAPACQGVTQSFGGRWFSVVGNGEILTASTAGTCAFDDTNPNDGTPASVFNNAISVYCGTADTICEDLTCVVAEAGDTACNLSEEVSWCSRDGEVYYVLVHGTGPENPPFFATGFFVLDVTTETDDGMNCAGAIACGQARPANDLCDNAVTIASGADGAATDADGTVNGVIVRNQAVNNNNAATDGHASPACTDTTDDIWYRYTAPNTSTITFSTCNIANFDTIIEVHNDALADCPTTSDAGLLLCDNDSAGCAGFTFDSVSSVQFGPNNGIVVFAGQTLLIRLGSPAFGVQEGTGTLRITVNITPSSCPGECPMGATVDAEPLIASPADETNGGCNMCVPAYDAIAAGETVCGQINTYSFNADLNCDTVGDGTIALRDTDWLTLVVPDTADTFGSTRGSRVTLRLSSEFPALFGVVGDTCAGNPSVETPFLFSSFNGGLCIDSELIVDLEEGTYRVVVTSFNTSGLAVGGVHEGHDYVLTVDAFEPAQLPPLNDHCVDAISILSNSMTVVDQRFGTNDGLDPGLSCHEGGAGEPAFGSVWYTFEATHTSVHVETCAGLSGAIPGDDSNFGVYEFTNEIVPCQSLVEIGCDDDGCPAGAGTFLSTTDVMGLTIGETYYIQFGAWDPSEQDVYRLDLVSPAP